MSLYSEFQQIIDALDSEGIQYALCGGLAMSVYDLPRATLDIDLLVLVEELGKAETVANKLGYKINPTAIPMTAANSEIHRMTKTSYEDEMPFVLDLLIAKGDLKEVWETRETIHWAGGNLCVVSRDGLIKMKQLRNSKKDQDDIDFLTTHEN